MERRTFVQKIEVLYGVKVTNLSKRTTEGALKLAFGTRDKIHCIYLARDETTGDSLGYGYVNFYNIAAAERAVEALNNTLLDGKQIQVANSKGPLFRGWWPPLGNSVRESSKRLVTVKLVQIPYEWEELDILAIAAKYELEASVYVPRVRRSKANRGLGFVRFQNADNAVAFLLRINDMHREKDGIYAVITYGGQPPPDRCFRTLCLGDYEK